MKKRKKKKKFKTEIRNESIRRFLFFYIRAEKGRRSIKKKKTFLFFLAKCGENITLKLEPFFSKNI